MPATLWPWALALVLAMAVVIVVLLVMVLKKSAKKQVIRVNEPEEDEEDDAAAPEQSNAEGGISAAFSRAREVMNSLCDNDPYRYPFYLMAGPEGSHQAGFLAGATGNSLNLITLDPVAENLAFGSGSQFNFFAGGAVLDVVGDQVVGRDGVASDDAGWKRILHELREMRPKRPIDGIVLTFSSTELLASSREEVERLKLTTRADRIQRKLWDVQRELGFRTPVYVLVTGCEELEGFNELCASFPEAAREQLMGQILGWSSPYSTTTPYRSEWVDDAFDLIHADLTDVQLALFADRPQAGDMLFFPWALRSMKTSLRTLLNHLFKASAYNDGAIFRGFYFCGKPGVDTAFIDQLFTQKIFPEVGLAVPTSRTRMARNREVRALQIATAAVAVLLFGGLGWAAWQFNRQKQAVKPLLEQSIRALAISPAEGDDITTDEAQKVLAAMAKIRFHHYGSAFVPSSWFSRFSDDLQLALQHTFAQVVLASVTDRLEEKVGSAVDRATLRIVTQVPLGRQRVMTWASPAADPYGDTVVAVNQTEEFKRLHDYLVELGTIEAKGRLLNDLTEANRGDLKMLGEVVQYAFGSELPRDFYRRNSFYEEALRETGIPGMEKFDPERHRLQTSQTARELFEALYDRVFTRNPFQARLRQLKQDLDSADTSRSYDVTRFHELMRDIRRVESDVGRPQLQWAFRTQFDLGPEFTHLLKAADKSKFISPQDAADIKALGEAEWGNFRTLLAERTRLTGPILQMKDGMPERRLSADTQMLQAALQSFLDQSFVAAPVRHAELVRDLPPQTRLVWNTRKLDQAVETYRAYERFREKGLKLFAPELWATVDDAARARLRTQMTDLLVEAQKFEQAPPPVSPAMLEEEVRDGVLRFTATVPAIQREVEVFTTLGMDDVRGDLTAITSAEALRLLYALDSLLEQEAPYTPRQGDFSWWDGQEPASPSAWDAKDPAELAAYLDASRARMTALTRHYAAPLLTWFKDGPHGEDRVVAKWQSIVDDLREAEEKKPGSAPALLDDYIATNMTRVTVNDCEAAQLTVKPARIRGYYATRVLKLSEDLSTRCGIAATDVAVERYEKLASYFNRRLAGRYPFAEGLPRGRDLEADADDIRQFFAMYDKDAGLFKSIGKRSAPASQLRAGQRFVKEMEEVRRFFAPFLDAEKPQRVPSYQVEPNFRTLEGPGDTEIIQWSLTIGSKTLTERDKGKMLPWTPGTPVKLALRWAANAPHVPVLIGERRGVSVVDRTISYEYTNQWSLLTALADLAAAELGPDVDAAPQTLALVVNRKSLDGGKAEEPAQAFMRMALLTNDAKPLDVPPLFPAKAPALERLTAEEMP